MCPFSGGFVATITAHYKLMFQYQRSGVSVCEGESVWKGQENPSHGPWREVTFPSVCGNTALPRGRFRADPGMNRVRERGSRSEVKQQGVGTAEYGCRTSDPAGADPRAATAAGGPGLFHGACHQTRQAGVCHTAAVRRLLFTRRGGNMAPLGENG